MRAERSASTPPPPATAWLLALLALSVPLGAVLAPSRAAAQEQAAGIVRVTSPVGSAQVYVDNEPVGFTPVTRYLPAGPHVIRVTADGYDPFVRRVEVVADTTLDVAAQLLPGNGTVEFVVQPAGAKLTLDGGAPVPTPVRLRDLEAREHQYRITAQGYETVEGSFTFERGKNLLFPVKLRSTAGLLEVRSTPTPARVWLDGQSVGETPLSVEDVPPGAHVVRLELADHATVFRRFDNSDGSKGDISVSMPEDGASLAVNTGHVQGVVRLEGHELGQGELVRVPELERGRYQLEVSAPGHKTLAQSVEVPPRGRLILKAELVPPDASGDGELTRVRPLVARWTFWGGVALGAGAATAGGVLLAEALTPEPVPESETVVVLP